MNYSAPSITVFKVNTTKVKVNTSQLKREQLYNDIRFKHKDTSFVPNNVKESVQGSLQYRMSSQEIINEKDFVKYFRHLVQKEKSASVDQILSKYKEDIQMFKRKL